MQKLLKRALGAAAIAGLSLGFVPLMAGTAAAAPGPQPDPGISPNPVPTSSSTFNLTVPTGTTCDGTGAAGWRVHTFIVDTGVDISTLDFTGATSGVPGYVGLDQDLSDGSVAFPLAKADAQAGVAFQPANSPAGLINPSDLSAYNFDPANGWVLGDGTFQVGFACTSPGNVLSQWWAQDVTIDADASSGSFLVVGAPAPAPVIDAVNVDDGEIIIDFTGTDADSFTAEATTVASDYSSPVGTATTVTDDTGSISITGLTNGTPYFVRVLAEKAGFADTPSAESGPVSPFTNGGSVVALAVTDQGTDDGAGATYVDIDWNPPAAVAGCTVTGYTVGSAPSGTVVQPDPDYSGAKSNSARITGLPTNQSITVTVTPTFGAGCVGTAANASAFIIAGNIVIQDIDVTRPVGALVLTQVCGNNGALPAEGSGAAATFGDTDNGTSNTPGTRDGELLTEASVGFDYPNALPPVSAAGNATVEQPWLTGAGTPTLTEDGADPDLPNYLEYPYPTDGNGVADPASETHCGLDMGVAEFVTTGDGAGQYFAADAALNQVTVVDTRNVDQGWTVSGSMSDFVASTFAGDGADADGLDDFSGDFLGWTPVVTEDTAAFDNDADPLTPNYDQQVVAGAKVEPNTNEGLGDGSSEVLASAAAGEGLGTTLLDARLKLLIPVNADAGLYEGALTFSAL